MAFSLVLYVTFQYFSKNTTSSTKTLDWIFTKYNLTGKKYRLLKIYYILKFFTKTTNLTKQICRNTES